jgi:hypothetical protein
MKWIKSSEVLPEHGQEVLIRERGIIYLAVFDKNQARFKIKNGTFLQGKTILWFAPENETKEVLSIGV